MQHWYQVYTSAAPQTTITGNAATASKAAQLTTARNIKLTGAVTGSASFNGTADASIATTLKDSGATAGKYGNDAVTLAFGGSFNIPQVTVDAKGIVTLIANKSIKLPAAPTTITGNAGSATKVPMPIGTIMFCNSTSATCFGASMGGTWVIDGYIDALVGSTATKIYMHRKTAN